MGRGPHLALTLKFLPRNRCLRDLFFPSAGTSVRRSESNPGQQMGEVWTEAQGSLEYPQGVLPHVPVPDLTDPQEGKCPYSPLSDRSRLPTQVTAPSCSCKAWAPADRSCGVGLGGESRGIGRGHL